MPSGKKKPEYWLFLEPCVMVSLTNNAVLFYHSLSGKRFESALTPTVQKIIRDLTEPDNGYVTGLDSGDMNEPDVQQLINQLEKYFMGDLLKAEWSEGKPVNILPEPYFKSYLTKESLQRQEVRESLNYDDYIHELDIYLSSRLPAGSPDPFPSATRQFIFPGVTTTDNQELSWSHLEPFIRQVTRFRITQVHLSGTHIETYPHLDDLMDLLTNAGVPVKLHFQAAGFPDGLAAKILAYRRAKIVFHFSYPIDSDSFNNLINDLISSGKIKQSEFRFAVSSQEELVTSRQIIAALHLPNASIDPYYTGTNLDFFRQAVFITREDIRSSKPDQKEVFSRISVNESDFGKFTLLPDGNVYANLSDPPVGNILSNSPEELILKELVDGISWGRIRKKVTPCQDCLYHFLCPPVSNYELLLKRFNCCDVFEKS